MEAIYSGAAPECVWFLEHQPVYTMGTSAKEEDVLQAGGIPVIKTSRGGQVTYHGGGQLVAYVMLNLANRGQDLHLFVRQLEQWIITSLEDVGVSAFTRKGRVGVWVCGENGEEKIAAIGIRVRKWISFHGVSINISPNLDDFRGIVPCGLPDFGVSSLKKLGLEVQMEKIIAIIRKNFLKLDINRLP